MMTVLAGCASVHKKEVVHSFPSDWPLELNSLIPNTQFHPVTGPLLVVQPVAMAASVETATAGRIPTTSVLTDWLIRALQARGINAAASSTHPPEYLLSVTIAKLTATETGGYPVQVMYEAQVAGQVTDTATGKNFWRQTLEQSHDRRLVVNMMSKLPERGLEHQQILMEKCLMPIFERLAQGLASDLKKGAEATG